MWVMSGKDVKDFWKMKADRNSKTKAPPRKWDATTGDFLK
jgi:hypothetical protein